MTKSSFPPLPEVFTAQSLQGETFQEPDWIVPSIIPSGLTLIGGRPKIGKSYLVLDVALALACGGRVMGKIQVQQQGVFYLCLEDQKRRLRKRINDLFRNRDWPSNLHMVVTWPRMDRGGLAMLEQWLVKRPDVKLVIVDTLARIKSRTNTNRIQYDADYHAMEDLKHIADSMQRSIIIITHVRKMDAEDPFDCISGSTGLTAAVDTGLVLRKNGTGKVLLYVRGRDVEEQELALQRDTVTGGWTLLGDSAEVRMSPERKDVIAILTQKGNPMSEREVREALGKSESAVKKLLWSMVGDGQITKHDRGYYWLNRQGNDDTPPPGGEGK